MEWAIPEESEKETTITIEESPSKKPYVQAKFDIGISKKTHMSRQTTETSPMNRSKRGRQGKGSFKKHQNLYYRRDPYKYRNGKCQTITIYSYTSIH